jgi:TfoX/Sxy family transcriptional regulator of competence genes
MPTKKPTPAKRAKKTAVKTGTARRGGSARMPKFVPAAEATKQRFAGLIAQIPQAEPRKMFGYPCAFVNGQMFFGVFGNALMLRLSDEDRAAFLKLPGAKLFEPMPGRPMKEYVEIPPALLQSESELLKWVNKGQAWVQPLPAKSKRR